jgi:hypothetical protein
MDFDGSTDLIVQDQSNGGMVVWYLYGAVFRSSTVMSPHSVNPNWKIKAVGDYNGDGKADLIFQHTNGSLYAWFMDGRIFTGGTFLTPAAVNPQWQLVGPR